MEPVSVEAALGSFASQYVGAYAKTAAELLVGSKRLAENGRTSRVNAQGDAKPSLGGRLWFGGLLIPRAPGLVAM
jgi:hypothetical protein